MNLKDTKFTEFLAKNKIECFQKEEIKDELNTTVFRTFLEIEGQNLPMAIVTDNSIYTNIRVQIIAKIIKEKKSKEILNFINKLNREYKAFKYYVSEDGDLCLDTCIVAIDEGFNPETVYTVINVILEHLTEYYSTFMKTVWSK